MSCSCAVVSAGLLNFVLFLVHGPARLKLRREREQYEGAHDARPSLFSSITRTFTGTIAPIQQFAANTFMPRASTYHPDHSHHGAQQSSNQKPAPFVRKIKVFMYNFGSPKVGNGNFVSFYDRMVPASYRVVVDGDLVAALPPQSNYSHVGTEILIDSMGAGSIIIDPSFVERWLRTHMKSSVAVHSLLVYRKGLLGIKLAAEFMRANASTLANVDPLRLALKVRTHQQVDSILDENAGLALDLEARAAESEFSAADRIAATVERPTSVSDEINARIPCVPPAEERKDGAQEAAVGMKLLSPTAALLLDDSEPVDVPAAEGEEGKTAEESVVANPLTEGVKRQASHQAGTATGNEASAEPTVDRQHAASHYAHDVENMQMLQDQMAAMRVPGPVRWIQEQATKRLHLGGSGQGAAEASAPPRRPDGSMKSGSSGKRGPDNV